MRSGSNFTNNYTGYPIMSHRSGVQMSCLCHLCMSLWSMQNAVKCDCMAVNISQTVFCASPCHF